MEDQTFSEERRNSIRQVALEVYVDNFVYNQFTMQNRFASRLLFLSALVGMSHFFTAGARADFTVTAKENADGSATFSLSGESPVNGSSPFPVYTNFSIPSGPDGIPLPPLSTPFFGNFPLPEGLQVSFDGKDPVSIDLLFLNGSFWFLGSYTSSFDSTSISGSGNVTVPNFPFYLLTPGTFRVEASEPLIDPNVLEGSPEPSLNSALSEMPFTTVYKVIPLDRNPSISAQSPGTIRVTSGGKGSGLIRITNTGNVPLEKLALKEASRDFKLGKPARTSLAPGETTTCPITFSGKKDSSVKVGITASSPERRFSFAAPASAPEGSEVSEIPPQESELVLPGEMVKTTVLVRGEIAGVRAPRNPVNLLKGKKN